MKKYTYLVNFDSQTLERVGESFAVKGDGGIAELEFVIPSNFGIPANQALWRVFFKLPGEKESLFETLPTVTQTESGDYVTAWVISKAITQKAGRLAFSIATISGENVQWNSRTVIMQVPESQYQPESEEVEEPYTGRLTALEGDMAAIRGEFAEVQEDFEELKETATLGTPIPESLVANMQEGRAYIYTGTEPGYTAGHVYYYVNGTLTDGGVYGGTAVDATLTQSGQAADAKKTGDEISAIKEDLSGLIDAIDLTLVTKSLSWTLGSEVAIASGANKTNESACRTGYVSISEPLMIRFDFDFTKYAYNIWTYTGSSVSSASRNLTGNTRSVKPDIIVVPIAGERNIRLSVGLVNGGTMTDADVAEIDAGISFYSFAKDKPTTDVAVEVYTDLSELAGWYDSTGEVVTSGLHRHSQLLAIRPNTTYYTGDKIEGSGYDTLGMFFDRYGNKLFPLSYADVSAYSYQTADVGAGSGDYAPMYTFTSPSNAYYFSLNFSNLDQYRYKAFVASKPIFATRDYGNLIIDKHNPTYQKLKDRKLAIIGTSQVMIDRLSRTGTFDGPNGSNSTQYVCGFQEYLAPWWGQVDSYGYSSASMMHIEGSNNSLYDHVVTNQLDLSQYDDVFITHSSTGITADNVGTLTEYNDLGDSTTFIGALRQIVNYVYSQNPNATIYLQTRLIRSVFGDAPDYNPPARIANMRLANERIRELGKLLALKYADTAENSGFNYYTAPYWCYDANGHPNQLGNKMIGLRMREDILGF